MRKTIKQSLLEMSPRFGVISGLDREPLVAMMSCTRIGHKFIVEWKNRGMALRLSV